MKRVVGSGANIRYMGYKTSETLLGIETLRLTKYRVLKYSYKTSETLLGIETSSMTVSKLNIEATKPLKPF